MIPRSISPGWLGATAPTTAVEWADRVRRTRTKAQRADAEEGAAWTQLWADVAALHRQAEPPQGKLLGPVHEVGVLQLQGQLDAQTPALLKGLIFGPDGKAMSPTHTRKGQKLYRYYISQSVLKQGSGACAIGRISAAEIETAVIDQLRGILRSPEIVIGTWRSARSEIDGLTEVEVREALEHLDPLWNELFPAEQARIVQLLVERVDVAPDGLDIRLRVDGLATLARDLGTNESRRAA